MPCYKVESKPMGPFYYERAQKYTKCDDFDFMHIELSDRKSISFFVVYLFFRTDDALFLYSTDMHVYVQLFYDTFFCLASAVAKFGSSQEHAVILYV